MDLGMIRLEASRALGVAPTELVFMLRTCAADLTGYGQFQWPASGVVTCPDWDPEPVCGGGLHGLPRGEGNAERLSSATDARWLVVAAVEREVVAITQDGGGKSKCPRAAVSFVGEKAGALELIQALHPGSMCVFGTATAGARGTATAGARGTATAGDAGTATAGDAGTATAGDAGTATAGDAGTATAGDDGSISVRYWDAKANRYRVLSADLGKRPGELAPRFAYRVDPEKRGFVRVAHDPTAPVPKGWSVVDGYLYWEAGR
jgi:hypothetical protein